jgi:hypothetical protein
MCPYLNGSLDNAVQNDAWTEVMVKLQTGTLFFLRPRPMFIRTSHEKNILPEHAMVPGATRSVSDLR